MQKAGFLITRLIFETVCSTDNKGVGNTKLVLKYGEGTVGRFQRRSVRHANTSASLRPPPLTPTCTLSNWGVQEYAIFVLILL